MARGPAYPYVNLEEAISLVKKMYDYAKRSSAPVDSVMKDAWKYSPTSSSSVKMIAALKYYGLIEELQSKDGSNKTIKITDRAYRILIDSPDSADRKKAVREAALSPRWYKFCWDSWGADMPPSMRSSLIFDHHFVDTTVDSFLRDYKKTIAYAELTKGQDSLQNEDESGDKQDYGQEDKPSVQSDNTNGVSFSGGSDVKPTDMGNQPNPQKFSASRQKEQGMKQEISTLDEGDVTITWPAVLSEESYQDLVDWMELLKRKIHRSTISNQSKSQDSSAQEA